MKIPILNGIYTDSNSDFRVSYPRNLTPVITNTGISNGYLRPADGILSLGNGPGVGRGGINWKNICYRVMGENLVKINPDGSSTTLASIPGSDQATLDYSFDYLGIASDGKLYFWDGAILKQVTDPDLGVVVDVLWVDGYWMTTDGSNLVVTELNDPFSVNPLKYGSSEADPDSINALLKVRNEVYALNRHTIEVFDNTGADLFPFSRIEGAQIEKGTIGTHSCCVFMEVVAFLGSGFNESPAVYLGYNSNAVKISTREIDMVFRRYSESELSSVICESRVNNGHDFLYIHLPDQTLVYDGTSSKISGDPVWFKLTSSVIGDSVFRGRNFVFCYDKWICEDPLSNEYGHLDSSTSSHYGDAIGWDFQTFIIYNNSKGAIFNSIELVALTGRTDIGVTPTIWTSYSTDGLTFSQEKSISAGNTGERDKRLVWRRQGKMRKTRIQKFRGTSDSLISFAAIEAELEPLYA